MKKLTQILLTALVAGAAHLASAVNYSPTHLLLVFRESGFSDVEFDLGSVSNYIGQTAGVPIPVNYDTNLVTTNFNNTLSGVSFAVVGAASSADPTPRVWLSDVDLISTPVDLTLNTYATLQSKIDSAGQNAKSATGGSAGPLVIDPSDPRSYSSIVSPGDITDVDTMGGDAPFTVEAVNPASLAFYEMIPTTTSPTPSAIKLGTFHMGADGTITFTPAAVTPVITRTTVPGTTARGAGATFTASAEGATGFQWYLNGVAIAGQTNSSLTVSNVQPGSAGNYTVTASNGTYGTAATSSNEVLRVTPAYVAGDAQLIFRESGFNDVEFNLGTVSNYFGLPIGTHLPVNYNQSLVTANFSTLAGVRFAVVAAASLSDSAPRLWLSDADDLSSPPSDLTPNTYATLDSKLVSVGNSAAALVHTIDYNNPLVISPSASGSYSETVSPDDNSDFGIGTLDGNSAFLVEAVNPATLAFYQLVPAVGTPPSASLVGAFVMSADGSITFTAGAVPPGISTQPHSQTNGTRNTALFTVAATGSSPFTYQWRRNGTNVSGATGSSLVITNLQLSDGGAYTAVINNAGGSITSSVASLTVFGCPVITLSPAELAYGISNSAYSQAISASGSTATPYTFTLAGGSLPSGLHLDSNGLLHGTPTTVGASTFTVTATDTNGCTGSFAYKVRINTSCGDATAPNAPVISYPLNLATESTNGTILARGTATDMPTATNIDQVLVSLNGGPPVLANVTAGAIPAWSVALTLVPGTNTISAVAVDRCGNVGLSSVTNRFQYALSQPLNLVINGGGTFNGGIKKKIVQPLPSGWPNLHIGQSYTVFATAGTGCVYSNMLTSAGGVALAPTNSITFTMQSNLTLTLNCPSNIWVANGGTYYGLFSDPINGPKAPSAGFATITVTPSAPSLSTGNAATFSGQLLVQGAKVNIVGAIDLNGNGKLTTPATSGILALLPIDVRLNLDPSGSLVGTVSNASNWGSALLADKLVWGKKAPFPLAPLAGKSFTFAMEGTNNGYGDGFAMMAFSSKGTPFPGFSGKYADGQKIAVKAPLQMSKALAGSGLTAEYRVPFYQALYPNTSPAGTFGGLMIGWLYLTNGTVDNTTNFTGQLPNFVWVKPSGVAAPTIMAGGFTNDVPVVGSAYAASPQLTAGAYTLTLSGGGLPLSPTNITGLVFSGTAFTTIPANPFALQIGFAGGSFVNLPAPGPFSRFLYPGTLTKVKFFGTVLQEQNQARGFFIDPTLTQSGAVLLH